VKRCINEHAIVKVLIFSTLNIEVTVVSTAFYGCICCYCYPEILNAGDVVSGFVVLNALMKILSKTY